MAARRGGVGRRDLVGQGKVWARSARSTSAGTRRASARNASTSKASTSKASTSKASQAGAIGQAVERVKQLRITRAFMRYTVARGGLLSGGVAYSALFSIAAALTIAWTVFMRLLGGNEGLRQSVIDAVNSALPGLLRDESGRGLISPEALVLDSAITPATVIAVPVLLWTATSVMQALASSVRAIFGITTLRQSVVVVRLRALGGFLVLAGGVVASALLTLAGASTGRTILGAAGIEGAAAGVLMRGGGLVASFVIDALVVVFLVRVMSAVRPVGRDLVAGALLASSASTVLRLAGTSLLTSVSGNALLASFAALAGLLLWLNLAARLFLVAVAYMANPPFPYMPQAPGEVHATDSPNFVTLSDRRTLAWPHDPLCGGVLPEADAEGLASYCRDLLGHAEGETAVKTAAGARGEPAAKPQGEVAGGPIADAVSDAPSRPPVDEAGASPGEAAVEPTSGEPVSGRDVPRLGKPPEEGQQWGGLAGRLARGRMERAERKALKAIEKALEAQDDYKDGVRRAVGQE